MSKNYDSKQLERAKRIRQLKLERLQKLVEVCNCCWPLVRYKNLHGHSDDCPYVELWSKWREEKQEALDDAKYR